MPDRSDTLTPAHRALSALTAGIPNDALALRAVETVAPEDIPFPCRELLVHADHMTTTLARHYADRVTLEVLAQRREGDDYRRRILLMLARDRRVVEFGIARIRLAVLPPDVRSEVLACDAPLGDILIARDVSRRIEARWFYRFGSSSPVLSCFRDEGVTEAYGRLGRIMFHEQPAVDVLEVVTGR